MAIYTRSVIVPFETVTADTIDTKDLPVNPISFLLLTIKFLSAGANTKPTLANILAMIDRLTVRFRGNNIISLSGEDLHAYTYFLLGKIPHRVNVADLDNSVMSYTFVIPFSRRLWDPNEAFPASSRGNLTLELDWASSFTNLDNATWGLEAIELPEAQPAQFLRCTTLTHTPAATGDNDIQLPIGNPLLMILLWGTTIPTGTTTTRTINSAQLMVDNQQRFFSKSEFESLQAAKGLRFPPHQAWSDHTHNENTAGSYTQNADTDPAKQDDGIHANYALMDFDPTLDGTYQLETAGLADLKLRVDAGDTSAIRILPVELFSVGA